MLAPLVSQATATESKHLSDVLDIIDKVTKILALFVGGAWVYLNYRRGRTFKHRLEPTITGKTIRTQGVLLLFGVAQVKNVGLSKVSIQQKGTAIEIIAVVTQPGEQRQELLHNKDIGVLDVFERHAWIEPGETIEESFLLSPPSGQQNILAFRIRLRIVSKGIEWNCDSLVEAVGVTSSTVELKANRKGEAI